MALGARCPCGDAARSRTAVRLRACSTTESSLAGRRSGWRAAVLMDADRRSPWCTVPDGARPAHFRGDRARCATLKTMSENVSVRLEDSLAERLRLRARAAGETLSDRLRRYAEEGVRRDEHPLITFRDGPTGRRAGLVGGPDVWEVAMWVEDLSGDPDPIAAVVEDSPVTRPQVDAALRYRTAYPDEIAARIELHRRETVAASRS